MALRLLGLFTLNAPTSAVMRFSAGAHPLSNMLPVDSLSAGAAGTGIGLNSAMEELGVAFNGTIAAFRNPETVAALKHFHAQQAQLVDNVSTSIVKGVSQLEGELFHGGGPQLLARALLHYEKEMTVFVDSVPGIVQEVCATLPPGAVMKPGDQLDYKPMKEQLGLTFNHTREALQQDAVSNISSAAERCDHMRPAVSTMRKLMWDLFGFSVEQEHSKQGLAEVETSPIVMIAPDIMPKFREFTVNTNLRLVHMTRSFALAIGNVTDFVMHNAEKSLGCSFRDKSHARPRQGGLGLLTGMALATAVALGFVS